MPRRSATPEFLDYDEEQPATTPRRGVKRVASSRGVGVALRHGSAGPRSQATRRTKLGQGVKPLAGGGGIFKSAAVEVLRQERRLMTTGEITKLALERKLITCLGKTPEATMASALYTDVKRKNNTSVFTRPQEGLFGLREWIDEGFFPDGWFCGNGAEETLHAPYRRSRTPTSTRSRETPGRTAKSRAYVAWRNAEMDDVVDEEEMEQYYDDEDAGVDDGAYYEDEYDMEGDEYDGVAGDEYADDEILEGEGEYEDEQEPLTPTFGLDRMRQIEKRNSMSALQLLINTAEAEEMGLDMQMDEEDRVPPPDPHHDPSGMVRVKHEVLTPRSPHDDKLAALHEAATSPLGMASVNARSVTPTGNSSRTGPRSKRQKLSVDIPQPQLEDAKAVLGAMCHTPAAKVLQDLETPQEEVENHMIKLEPNLEVPEQTLMLGPVGMVPPSPADSPLSLINNPMVAAATPTATFQGMVSVRQLGAAPEDGSLIMAYAYAAAAAQHQLHQTIGAIQGMAHSHAQQEAEQEMMRTPPKQGTQHGDLANGTEAPQLVAVKMEQQQGKRTGPESRRQQPQGTGMNDVEMDLESLGQLEKVVTTMSAAWGASHPHVGKVCLVLSRMYRERRSVQKSTLFLGRAWDILNACMQQAHQEPDNQTRNSFQYLAQRLQALPHEAM